MRIWVSVWTTKNKSSPYLYNEWGPLISGKVHTNGFYSDAYLYNGEAMDITTELYYLRARYYDPSQGRFMQQDTFLGYIETPISQNLYIYCGKRRCTRGTNEIK